MTPPMGRPRRKKQVADKFIRARVTTTELRYVQSAAKALGLSVSAFIHQLIADHKKRNS